MSSRRSVLRMRIILAMTFAALIIFTGCSIRISREPSSSAPEQAPAPAAPPSSSAAPPSSSKPEPSSSAPSAATPEGAAEELINKISNLDDSTVKDLAGQYLSMQEVPDAYLSLLKPITERVEFDVGKVTEADGKAGVGMTVTSIDAESALNSIIPGALAHMAALQLTGKDVSEPEKILAQYAADNIAWDAAPTIKTETVLYLIQDENGEWKVDAANPENVAFANAVTGGAISVAENLRAFLQR